MPKKRESDADFSAFRPAIYRKLDFGYLLVRNTSPIFIGTNYMCIIMEHRLAIVHLSTFTVINSLEYSSNIQNARMHEQNGLNFLYVLTDDRVVHCHAIDVETARIAVVARRSFVLESFANDFFVFRNVLLAFHDACAVLYSLNSGNKVAELHGHQLRIYQYQKALLSCECGAKADTFTDVLDALEDALWKPKNQKLNEYLEMQLASYRRSLPFCCSCCNAFPKFVNFAPSDFYGIYALPSLRQISAAFGAGLRDQDEYWTFSRAEFSEYYGNIVVLFFGEMPEIVVFYVPCTALDEYDREKRFLVVYPTNRISGMTTNAWLDESLFGSDNFASTSNFACCDCDLFASDINEIKIVSCAEQQLYLAVYSGIYGYFEISVQLNQLIAGNVLEDIGPLPSTIEEYERKVRRPASFNVLRKVFFAYKRAVQNGELVQATFGRLILGLTFSTSSNRTWVMLDENVVAAIEDDVVGCIRISADERLTGVHASENMLYCWGNEALYVIYLDQ